MTERDRGWLLLAEGDLAGRPIGPRTLARRLRAGGEDPADHDDFVRIRLAYEGAADRLPDAAWPWYRLAELLAWAGFVERAREHLAQAEKRSLGDQAVERTHRSTLTALVHAAMGDLRDTAHLGPRPFPPAPHGAGLTSWLFRALPRGRKR